MGIERYFSLREGVYFVKGAARAALYDPLQSQDVFSIDSMGRECLELLLAGSSVEEVSSRYPLPEQAQQWLASLVENNLGRFCSPGEVMVHPLPPREVPKLYFLWFELTQGCNLTCTHCCTESSPEKARLENNVRKLSPLAVFDKAMMKHEDWLRVLDQAGEIPISRLQLIGGEPFLYGKIFDLLEYAGSKNIPRREVYTNGTLLNRERALRLKELGVLVALSLYGNEAAVHEEVTQRKGSFEKTRDAIQLLQSLEVPVRVAIVAMHSNEAAVEKTIRYVKEKLDVDNVGYDLVRPAGRGCTDELVPPTLYEKSLMTAPNFPKLDMATFVRRIYGHSCLQGELYIAATGVVYPCVMEKNNPLGDVKKSSLQDILNGKDLDKFWSMSKDKIEICRDCEYRYGCFDCRPKAMAGDTERLLSKPKECLYNPHEGVWDKQ